MNTINLYKALSDELRIRMLNLLKDGPLCVCHIVEIVEAEQVTISKQLKYMKDLGLLCSERQAQWNIYRICEQDSPLLQENLETLATSDESLPLRADIEKRNELLTRICETQTACPSAIVESATS